MMATLRSFFIFPLIVAGATGCATADETAPEVSEGAVEVQAQDLWAGSVSYAIERSASDPCNNGANKLDTEPLEYESWARQRATIRNVCFEVWKPGVTDRENPDFWRLLDVKVHYRFKGTTDWKAEPVNALDRRGNNRRYAWSLKLEHDPMHLATGVVDLAVPFEIKSETERYASVAADMEFYFTVNDQKLDNSRSEPFVVRYLATLGTSSPLEQKPNGHVLDESIVCDGLTLGSGAGYFVGDVRDQAAVAALGAGLDGSLIYGSRVSVGGSPGAKVLSVAFGATKPVDNQTFPTYVDGEFLPRKRAETKPSGTSITLVLATYDRAAKQRKELTHTFTNCALR